MNSARSTQCLYFFNPLYAPLPASITEDTCMYMGICPWIFFVVVYVYCVHVLKSMNHASQMFYSSRPSRDNSDNDTPSRYLSLALYL